MKNIEYITGGSELIDFVKPLWEILRDHHGLHSQHFSNQYAELTFEKRKSKLLAPSTIQVKIDLVKISEKNEYIGYCISTINAELTGEVDSLYLESEYRKMGIGNELMARALNWMDDKQVKTKVVSVGEGNEAVFSFYQQFGFYKRRTILEQISFRDRSCIIESASMDGREPNIPISRPLSSSNMAAGQSILEIKEQRKSKR